MTTEDVVARIEEVMGAAKEAAELRIRQLHWRYGIGMTALGAALVIAVILLPRCTPDPVVPPAVQARMDSLEATHQTDLRVREQLRVQASEARDRAAAAAKGESSAKRVADSLSRVIAERVHKNNASASPPLTQPAPTTPRSSAPAPPPTDPGGGESVAPGGSQASFWRDLYGLRTEEADSLRSALFRSDSARGSWARADSADRARADQAEIRIAALERVNRELGKATEGAEKKCRVLWVASCPTRRTSFVAGVVTGAVAVVALTR